MRGYVYILISSDNRFYVGSTTNLDRRLKQHRNGHTQTTRNMKDIELVLTQEYDSLDIARKIEKRIKRLKRKDYIQKMVDDGEIKMKIK